MDNFKLYFYGNNDITSVDRLGAGNKTMKVEFFTLDGRRVSGLQKGITISKAIMENGNVVVKKIRK